MRATDKRRATDGLRGLAEESALRGGDLVKVWAAAVGDLGRLEAMFSRSSRETIHRRFRMAYADVPERVLPHLLDPNRHGGGALAAVSDDRVVGHAMHGRPEDGEAEVGMVVEDGWQSLGIGSLLLSELARNAARRGIETFVCSSPHESRTTTRLSSPARTKGRRPDTAESRRTRPGTLRSPVAPGAA